MKVQSLVALIAAAALTPGAVGQTGALKLAVVAGQEQANNIRLKAISPIEVELRDERNVPVDGARVTFSLPSIGPGGKFPDGTLAYETYTDKLGRATCNAFVPNDHEGRFSVLVHAAATGREAAAHVTQTNARYLRPRVMQADEWRRPSNGRTIAIVVGVAAVATLAAVLATRGKGSGPAAPPIPVSVGGVIVGGPR